MGIKKALALTSMSLAAIACVAPATAQAEAFWTKAGAFVADGTFGWERAGFDTGPANIVLEGVAENGEEMGEGVITAGALEGPKGGHIATNLPGCTATGNLGNTPWSMTLTEVEKMDIPDATFTFHYFEGGAPGGCPKFGIPSTVSIVGTITVAVQAGLFEGSCFNLNIYTDHMHVEGQPAGATADLDGFSCTNEIES